MLFDAVVLGAGPAGSATACDLAGRGFKVALLDRSAFPRDKACGDILAPEALARLGRMGLSGLFAAYSANETWRLFLGGDDTFIERRIPVRASYGTRWATIPRLQLDAALLDRARQAGALVFERVLAHGLTRLDDRVRVEVSGLDGSAVEARLAVVATGSLGPFARAAPGIPFGVAVRGYYEGPADQPVVLRSRPELLPGGYEWQFPITHTLYNIGVGTTRSVIQRSGLCLEEHLRRSALTAGKRLVGRLRGGGLNYSATFAATPAHADRVLWVGDAAGLVEPHLGEGIRPALRSAEIAAECAAQGLERNRLAAGDLAAYTHRLRRELAASQALARLVFGLMSHPALWQAAGRAVVAAYLAVRPHERGK